MGNHKPSDQLTSLEAIELARGFRAARDGQIFSFLESDLWQRGHMLWTDTHIAAFVRNPR